MILSYRDHRKMSKFATLILLALLPCIGFSQEKLPIIDVHLHAMPADAEGPPPLGICAPYAEFPTWDPSISFDEFFLDMFKNPPCDDPVWSPETDEEVMNQTIEMMEKYNIIGVLNGSVNLVSKWKKASPDRFITGLNFNLARDTLITSDSLRNLVNSGAISVFGEITNQYAGIEPNDERMEPYWIVAEELDISVSIHIGPGPPGVIYVGAGNYRARMHSAMSIEDVLVQRPKLRINIMHAGYPLLDDLLAVLYAHPQVYVDIGVISFTQPRAAFHRFLRGIIEAGFGKRVMFGSDQMVWPAVIPRAIAAVEEAEFLSDEQKRDIFYNNAAKFLRLSSEEIEKHHQMGVTSTDDR